MTVHTRLLRRLAAKSGDLSVRPFPDIVDDARALRTLAVSAVAVGAAASAGTARGRDAVLLALDVLRDPLTEHDDLRAELMAAVQRAYPNAYADVDVIADRLAAMPSESIQRIMNAVQGALFELRVAEMIDQGEIPLPEGATAWEPAGFGEAGVDGRFVDADGGTVSWVQIKAARGPEAVTSHLERYPEVDTVLATTEAVPLAGSTGVYDTGVSVHDLLPGSSDEFVDVFATSLLEGVGELIDDVPVLALGLIAAEVTATIARGGDVEAALGRARERVGRVVTWSALGSAVAHLSGLEPARHLVTVGGQAAAGWVSRAAADQDAAIAGFELLRHRLVPLRVHPG